MHRITLYYPQKLVFGVGSFRQFFDDFQKLGLKNLYIVTIRQLFPQLQEGIEILAKKGINVLINDSLAGEPTFADFERLLEEARSVQVDSVLGIGGGSVLDLSKLIAAQLLNTQSTGEICGNGQLKERRTYLACIPTTSGTGSEVSPNAILVNDEGAKVGVISPFLLPDASYVDPALTVSVPQSITASTGIDALTHCLEAYTNKFAHPVIDTIALEGVRLIAANLQRACDDGSDIEARTNVALGSVYGGMCLGPVNTAAVHALAYPLGTQFHIAHGLSIALLLPYVMEFNLPAAPQRYAQLALSLGAKQMETDEITAKQGVRIIRQLIKDCGLPSSLAELGIPASSIENMAAEAVKIQRLLKNNVREVSREDAANIYRSAFKLLYETT